MKKLFKESIKEKANFPPQHPHHHLKKPFLLLKRQMRNLKDLKKKKKKNQK